LGLFSILAVSKTVTLHVVKGDKKIDLSLDDEEKFGYVYLKTAELLKVEPESFVILKGRTPPHRCQTIRQNLIKDGTTLVARDLHHNLRHVKLQGGKQLPVGPVKNFVDSGSFRYNPGMMCRKPVIYLYPTKETDATVAINTKAMFTAVYPQFTDAKKNEWKVHAYPCGKLVIDKREYSSLFWEGARKQFVPKFQTGFVVDRKNAVKFLEEKLKLIGLTDKEANEFITYWIPVLNKNGKSVVSFQFDNYDKQFPLEVSPKPDTVIRVFLAIRKARNNESIEEQKLTTIKREGFTVVEWGGCEVPAKINHRPKRLH